MCIKLYHPIREVPWNRVTSYERRRTRKYLTWSNCHTRTWLALRRTDCPLAETTYTYTKHTLEENVFSQLKIQTFYKMMDG